MVSLTDVYAGRSALDPSLQLFLMSEGTIVLTTLAVAAELGIADHLAQGSRHYEDLAKATATHPRSLYRVLRLLSSLGVFKEVEPSRFGLTPVGELLRSGVQGSMRSWLRMCLNKIWFHTFANALDSVRTGEPIMTQTIGVELFKYLGKHPAEAAIFDEAMSDYGQSISVAVATTYDFSGFKTIADIGGGNGSLLKAILEHHPTPNGVLFDLPHVVDRAGEAIAKTSLRERIRLQAGSFFDSIPVDADAYLLKWVIHDWEKGQAITILKNCRAAMKPGSRLLLIESLIPEGDAFHPGKFIDVVMLVALGGQERTEAEYGELLREAGFRLTRIVPTPSSMGVIEAVPN